MDPSPLDSSPPRSSLSRDRPTRAPSGPRTRTRHKNSLDIPSDTAFPCTPHPFTRPNSPAQNPATDAPQLTLAANTADVACKPAIATCYTPTPLPPPPDIPFQPTPIPWKGLPLEAAQWSFSSAELQHIVSNAIRLSAKESFVRLLSIQALETDIVHESVRLEDERRTAQAKWKFEVARRTMLLQALNSSAAVVLGGAAGDTDHGLSLLISQLASAIGTCDAQLSSILQIWDQQSQIAVVQHRHWASALSLALRKLNKAYERQGDELKRVLTKVQTLEDELEEAWKEAEGIAAEIDDMDNHRADSDSDDDHNPKQDATAATAAGDDDDDDTGTLEDVTIGQVVGVTAFAVASKATLVAPEPPPPKPDAKSVKSTRSKRSTRDGPSRVSRVSAARTRSRAASNASLRLPKALRAPSATYANAPPIPARPDTTSQGHSFLDMGNVGNEYIRHPKRALPMRQPEPKSALPDPPHTASLPRTQVPSIWLAAEAQQGVRPSSASASAGSLTVGSNGLDRSRSLHIFPSFTSSAQWSRRAGGWGGRRSQLVMSLSNSDPGPSSPASVQGQGEQAQVQHQEQHQVQHQVQQQEPQPQHQEPQPQHQRHQQQEQRRRTSTRPGSAGARLVHHDQTPPSSSSSSSLSRSFVGRAGSVLFRRLSQATFGSSARRYASSLHGG